MAFALLMHGAGVMFMHYMLSIPQGYWTVGLFGVRVFGPLPRDFLHQENPKAWIQRPRWLALPMPPGRPRHHNE